MKKSLVCVVLLIGLAGSLVSQQFVPPPNQNAALRYWMSFADLVDRPTDEATNKAIDDVLSGAAAWDEQKLGSIVDANEAAVRSLQRATKLSECNWGLEYDRGFAMSLGHLPKARVIARLNALYGARQLAKGDTAGAVDTWLAGLRFAQHVGEGVSLIGTLSARPAFTANLHLLARAVQERRINAELQTKIRAQLQKLPSDGLDWTSPVRAEAWADEDSLKYLANASNFAQTYRDFFGRAPAAGVVGSLTAGHCSLSQPDDRSHCCLPASSSADQRPAAGNHGESERAKCFQSGGASELPADE